MDPRAIYDEGNGFEQDSGASSAAAAGRKPSRCVRRPSLRNGILKGPIRSLVALLVISCLSGTAHSQDFEPDNIRWITTSPYHFVPHHGAILRAQEGVTLFSHAPSRFFGNLFNEEITRLEGNEVFSVEDIEIYPGIGGNQIWLRLTAHGSGACPPGVDRTECWALYGLQPKTDSESPVWNFIHQSERG